MSMDEMKSQVAGWIRSRTMDGSLAVDQIRRFNDAYGLLHQGVAHFWFRKTDGSLRSAYGTLDMDIIGRHNGVPEGEERNGRAFNKVFALPVHITKVVRKTSFCLAACNCFIGSPV